MVPQFSAYNGKFPLVTQTPEFAMYTYMTYSCEKVSAF